MAAAVNSVAASHHQYHQKFPAAPPLSRPQSRHFVPIPFSSSSSSSSSSSKTRKESTWPLSITQRANKSKFNHPLLVVSVAASENNNNNNNLLNSSNDSVDQQQDLAASAAAAAAAATGRAEQQDLTDNSQVGGFAFESNASGSGSGSGGGGGGGGGGGASLIGDMGTATNTAAAAAAAAAAGFSSSSSSSSSPSLFEGEDLDKNMADRAINAAIVLAAGTFAITKLLTIDSDYWHGWTLFEILRYAPLHNWTAYEEALKTNPVLAKMMISGVVYSVGDWIAQCYEGKPLFDFDRARMFRSGLVGFSLHGSLSHYYYYFCEALFPFQDWWVVPAKVLFDQTVWAAIWNSIYYVVLGFLRFESPVTIFRELKATFWPMLTAGWKLWPFAHLITYGVIPVEQRLLWVDCVELVWVTILSTYSNEKSEARHSEALSDSNTRSLEE